MIPHPKKAWRVNLPDVGILPFNFTFTTLLPPGEFGFLMRWFADQWNLWVTLPSGEIRQAGVFSNLVNWSGFGDYLLGTISAQESIGQNDLAKVALVVYQQ